MSLVTTPAVLLRAYPYSESSQVLRFYTEALGSVGVMGRGVRAGSGKGGSGLDSFVEGALTLIVKPTRDLQTLKEFVPTRPRRALGTDVRRFGGAAVLAELVLRHAAEESSPGALFGALGTGLDRLADAAGDDIVAVAIQEAWRLVVALGYRPALDGCVECGAPLGDALARFDLPAGGLRCERCSSAHGGPRLGPGARAQLAALLDCDSVVALDRPRAHLRLLSDFVTWHLCSGKPLASFQVLVDLIGAPSPEPTGA